MASQKNYKTFEKNGATSRNSILHSGSSSPEPEGENDSRLLSKSCPAVLEPSKDESHRSYGRLKNALTGLLTHSCPLPSTERSDERLKDALTGLSIALCPQSSTEDPSDCSSGQSHSHEDEQRSQSGEEIQVLFPQPNNEEQQRDESRANYCASFMESYKSYVDRIKISWFIFIFQLVIGLICISAIVMGITFYISCEDRSGSMQPVFGILMGIFGVVLVCMWFATVCRIRRGDRFWNDGKTKLVCIFITVMCFMIGEFLFFIQVSPQTLQEERIKKVKCPQTYYDYLLYMHIAIAGCLLLAALLYLPDCCIFLRLYEDQTPSQANGHAARLRNV